MLSNYDRNTETTIYVSNLDVKVNEELIWELFIQVGHVISVVMPRDEISREIKGYCFVEFKNEIDAEYSIKIMHNIKLFSKPIRISSTTAKDDNNDIGANIFINNLDKSVTDSYLFNAFVAFGRIINCKIIKNIETQESKGYAYISYDSFESSDKAISSMDQKYFSNKQIKVAYAFKNSSKKEKHGSIPERILAANLPRYNQEDNDKLIIPENINNIGKSNENNLPSLPAIPQ